jgi:predicted transcriptional regulator
VIGATERGLHRIIKRTRLHDALADYLEWERQDFQQAVDAVREGHEDLKAGRSVPAEQFLDDFARKHRLPR